MTEVPYWKRFSEGKKAVMTVREMEKMLGLKKTEGYWLMHRGLFKSYQEDGKYLIDFESFENWYANQVRYSKVEGPPPGEELRKNSYSVRDIAGMLGLCEEYVYEIIARDKIETVVVDFHKRVTKETFDKWYQGQTRYRVKEDREKDKEEERDCIWLPDAARLLGTDRGTVYGLVRNKGTRDQFEVVEINGKKRVTKESFYKWYVNQTEYQIQSEEVLQEIESYRAKERLEKRLMRLSRRHCAAGKNAGFYNFKNPKNPNFYTVEEICRLYGFSKKTVLKWIHTGMIPVVKIGRSFRIPRDEFDDWLDMLST